MRTCSCSGHYYEILKWCAPALALVITFVTRMKSFNCFANALDSWNLCIMLQSQREVEQTSWKAASFVFNCSYETWTQLEFEANIMSYQSMCAEIELSCLTSGLTGLNTHAGLLHLCVVLYLGNCTLNVIVSVSCVYHHCMFCQYHHCKLCHIISVCCVISSLYVMSYHQCMLCHIITVCCVILSM